MLTPNPYDPDPSATIQKVKDAIIEDLSPLGDVRVDGHITPLGERYLMDGVTATVTPRSGADKMALQVKWNIPLGCLAYLKDGRSFEKPLRSYDGPVEPSLKNPAPAVVNRVMNRLRTMVPKSTRAERATWWYLRHTESIFVIATLAVVLLPAIPMFGAGAFAPLSLLSAIVCYLFLGAVAWFLLVIMLGPITMVLDDYLMVKVADRWEMKSSSLFYSLFDTDQERVEFLGYLLELCAERGIQFKDSPKVHYGRSRWRDDKASGDVAVSFDTKWNDTQETSTVLFDGQDLTWDNTARRTVSANA